MIDITMDPDDELSIRVESDMGFLFLTQESAKLLLESVKETYVYTDTQLEFLKDDIEFILNFPLEYYYYFCFLLQLKMKNEAGCDEYDFNSPDN